MDVVALVSSLVNSAHGVFTLQVILADVDESTRFPRLLDLVDELNRIYETPLIMTVTSAFFGGPPSFNVSRGFNADFMNAIIRHLMRDVQLPMKGYKCGSLVLANGDDLYSEKFIHVTVEALRESQSNVTATDFVSGKRCDAACVKAFELRKCGPTLSGVGQRFSSLLEAGCVAAGAVHARASVFDGTAMNAFLDKMTSLRAKSRWLTADAYDEMYVSALAHVSHRSHIIMVPQVLYVQALDTED